ncbi:putative F420-dependent oxidoreductase [Antricoccus suffuscus]|uniref:Putative F420-dependent oxidoreductase n=1 Tax=Antricoccus suffuscus TaxID=1629062 RepID=A0A2T1A632_9ACTN|nr:LLM class F420-dependent oxidoreductase [Antricoccus suffuscus]PRZ44049.1 putative F420-dependent oxidoreductase [Antricoccus suffuscus]
MKVDGNIGGTIDGTAGARLADIRAQVATAEDVGYDGVWTAETSHDPFLPLMLAAEQSAELTLGTSIAVAFARNPMTMAVTANDLQSFSGGRFIIGLGTQIKPHIERRFSMPWSEPAKRMREFIEAMHAIWDSWESGDRLSFRGDFYTHTLMTPMFSPGPNPWGPPSVMLAAVGPKMTSVAAEVADGLLVHGFTTERYFREVTMTQVEAGLSISGRDRDQFSLIYPGFVATGRDEAEFEAACAGVRKQIAFYGSTPAYRGVLELHGWGELQTELHALSLRGEWDTMAGLIDDDVLNAFAVVGEPASVGAEIRRRFDGIADRFSIYAPYDLDDAVRRDVVSALHS